MATVSIVKVTDDLDGEIIEDLDELDRVAFSYRGVDYEIDLRTAHGEEFDEEMKRWTESATRVGGRKQRTGGSTTTKISAGTGAAKPQLKAMREWAIGEGYEVAPRGRISADIMEAYDAAH